MNDSRTQARTRGTRRTRSGKESAAAAGRADADDTDAQSTAPRKRSAHVQGAEIGGVAENKRAKDEIERVTAEAKKSVGDLNARLQRANEAATKAKSARIRARKAGEARTQAEEDLAAANALGDALSAELAAEAVRAFQVWAQGLCNILVPWGTSAEYFSCIGIRFGNNLGEFHPLDTRSLLDNFFKSQTNTVNQNTSESVVREYRI